MKERKQPASTALKFFGDSFLATPGRIFRGVWTCKTNFCTSDGVQWFHPTPMDIINTNIPWGKGRSVSFMIKQIAATYYLPVCLLQPSDTDQFLGFSDFKALNTPVIFQLLINGKIYEYPMVFTTNGQQIIGESYFSVVPEQLSSVEVSVVPGDLLDVDIWKSSIYHFFSFILEGWLET